MPSQNRPNFPETELATEQSTFPALLSELVSRDGVSVALAIQSIRVETKRQPESFVKRCNF